MNGEKGNCESGATKLMVSVPIFLIPFQQLLSHKKQPQRHNRRTTHGTLNFFSYISDSCDFTGMVVIHVSTSDCCHLVRVIIENIIPPDRRDSMRVIVRNIITPYGGYFVGMIIKQFASAHFIG
jgi:hypothetical protein